MNILSFQVEIKLLKSENKNEFCLYFFSKFCSIQVLGPPWERTVGSLTFLWQILIFDILGNFIHLIFALVFWFNPWIVVPSLAITCTLGFSGSFEKFNVMHSEMFLLSHFFLCNVNVISLTKIIFTTTTSERCSLHIIGHRYPSFF
jgi:hypothetical protein